MVLKLQVVQFVWPTRTSPKEIHWALGQPGNTGSTHGSADTKALLTTGPPKKANYQEKMVFTFTAQQAKKNKNKKNIYTQHQEVTCPVTHPEFVPCQKGWTVRVIAL